MSPSIRLADHSDLEFIQACNIAMAAQTEDVGLNSSTLAQGIHHILEHSQDGFYLIAEYDGEAVGTLMVTFEWSDWRNGRFWWIQSVFVSPPWRRRGIYTALHQEVRRRARKDSTLCGIRLYVEKDNLGAQKTYEEMGMGESHYKIYEELI